MKLDEMLAHARRVTAEVQKIPDPCERNRAVELNAELLVREARCDAMIELVERLEGDGRLNAARWVLQQLKPEQEQLAVAVARARGVVFVRLN